jgi:murein tripeptide amidase MpaA
MDFLLSKEKDSEYLRKNYEFKIIPMMNPDGVAVGNYRTNLMGFDLNRRWDCSTKSKITH